MKTLISLVLLLAITYSITVASTGSDADPSIQPSPQITQSFSGVNYQLKNIYNSKGKLILEQAQVLGVQPRDLAAVLKVESAGNGFTASTGKMIIRFENHVFYRYFTNSGKDAAKVAIYNQYFKHSSSQTWKGHQFRTSTSAAWQDFHGSQDKEWQVLKFAQGLDDTSALYSASYGVAQIMGFNYKALGYSNVQTLFVDFSKSIKSQLLGMFSFIKNNSRCYNALLSSPSNYVSFATCYNGSGQAEYYGNLISQAAVAYDTVTATIGQNSTVVVNPVNKSLKLNNIGVFSTQINLRSGPGTSYTVVGKTSNGLECIVASGATQANGYTFYKVVLADGTIGYAAADNGWLNVKHAFEIGTTVTFQTSVKYRSQPGTSQTLLGTATAGTSAKITTAPQVANGYFWYGMSIGGKTVYAPLGTSWYI